ncbi:hypothetical protein DFJ73DRAFT_755990 [Zopfochytrium polystomum]|nr:hypothetical protein DFJ73DRAFT_755990 [Zopfochytrium polystomum]
MPIPFLFQTQSVAAFFLASLLCSYERIPSGAVPPSGEPVIAPGASDDAHRIHLREMIDPRLLVDHLVARGDVWTALLASNAIVAGGTGGWFVPGTTMLAAVVEAGGELGGDVMVKMWRAVTNSLVSERVNCGACRIRCAMPGGYNEIQAAPATTLHALAHVWSVLETVNVATPQGARFLADSLELFTLVGEANTAAFTRWIKPSTESKKKSAATVAAAAEIARTDERIVADSAASKPAQLVEWARQLAASTEAHSSSPARETGRRGSKRTARTRRVHPSVFRAAQCLDGFSRVAMTPSNGAAKVKKLLEPVLEQTLPRSEAEDWQFGSLAMWTGALWT